MDNIHPHLFQISELILKEITGNISEKEKVQLDKWSCEFPEYAELYRKLQDKHYLSQGYQELKKVPDTQALENMYLRIRQDAQKSRRSFLRWLSSSAALIALIIGAYYFIRSEKADQQTSDLPIARQQLILPGTTKALLRLSDGTLLDPDTLYNSIEQAGVEISRTEAQKLNYQASDDTSDSKEVLIYNEITVPRGGEFDLVLADGTQVWLNAESRLRFPVNFVGDERRVFLEGEAYFSVQRNEQKPFRVELSRQTIEVLGTEFNVSGYKDESLVFTTLVSGKVKVCTETSAIELEPGEQSITNPLEGEIKKRKVRVSDIISWKEGLFVLEEETLEQITQKFARWYDVSFVFQQPELKEMTFKGRVPRYSDLNEVLITLEKTNEIRFRMEDKTIVVYK